jgi:biopolymer transport protein TolR
MAFDSSSEEEYAPISQINVTPLVDVMLVLLIIFMVAAPVIQQGVELELPRETITPLEGEGEQFIVSVNKDGKVFIGSNNEVAVKDLGGRVKGIISQRKDKRVFIRADKRVTYGEVMAVMAAIRRAGVDKVGLMTEPS